MIRRLGGLWSMAELRRNGHAVPAPGGNEWSQDADAQFGMDEYVHLCFRQQHPMEFKARQEQRIVDSVFLEIDPSVLQAEGALFTEEVSNKSGCVRYTLDDAVSRIDFEVLYSRTDWRDAAIQARLRTVEKYEILVPTKVPLKFIRKMPNG